MAKADKPNEMRFEDAIHELEKIVAQMETGNLPLDGMIDAYRRGAQLVRDCRDKLNAAQVEIKKLQHDKLIPFEDDSDANN